MRILLAEDDDSLREGLTDLLASAGHVVVAVTRGDDAVGRGQEEAFDLVVLDLMLPGLDGHEVCRRLRTSRPGLGVLMLTALGSRNDKVLGFRAGADDYLVKPFAPEELLARVEALGRRLVAGPPESNVLESDGCVMDLGRLVAQRDGKVARLTPRDSCSRCRSAKAWQPLRPESLVSQPRFRGHVDDADPEWARGPASYQRRDEAQARAASEKRDAAQRRE